MPNSEHEIRAEVVSVCQRIHQKGWVAANDGNVSVRLDESRVLCTPTAVSKGCIQADDLIVCNLLGEKLNGSRDYTSEIAMHLVAYKVRPDVQAVVHAHPPVATGFATAGRALDKALLPEVIVQLGAVPLARYGLPGTPALSENLLPLLPHFDAVLLENHGCTTLGGDVWQAFYRMEIVEHLARVTMVAEMVGGARALPRDEVEKLFASRERYHVKSPNSMFPRMPLVAEDLLS